VADLAGIGRMLVAAGLTLAVIGLLLIVAPHVPGLDRLGRLPGDILVQRGNTTVFIPIVTSIVVSVALTIILNLFIRR
jgi:predicted cobalt transporter CbtA